MSEETKPNPEPAPAPPEGPKDHHARTVMQSIARDVKAYLPEGWGFFVLTFPFGGEPGRCNYVANADRNDVIKVMKDWIRRAKSGVDPFKHHPK